MKCSNTYWVTSKEASYKTIYEGQNLLQRGGFIKKIEQDDNVTWTPFGMTLRARTIDVITRPLVEESYFESMGGSPELMFRGDVKSYKHLGNGTWQIVDTGHLERSGKLGLFGTSSNEVIRTFALHGSMETAEEQANRLEKAFFTTLQDQISDVHVVVDDHNPYFRKTVFGKLANGAPIHVCKSCGKVHDASVSTQGRKADILGIHATDAHELEYVHTPECKSIQQLETFFDCAGHAFLKTIILEVQGAFYAILLRGDRTLSIEKAARAIGIHTSLVRMADKEVFTQSTGIEAGFIGPVGLREKNVKILVDLEVDMASGLIAGGNRTDYHVAHVRAGRDFVSDWTGDLKEWEHTDGCQSCGGMDFDTIGAVRLACFERGIADGCLTRFPFKVIGQSGKEEASYVVKHEYDMQHIIGWMTEMSAQTGGGGQGLGLGRIYAPFQIGILCMNPDDEIQAALSTSLYDDLTAEGYRVLVDDSKERGGVKFSNFDLTGARIRITVGKMAGEGKLEFKAKYDETVETVDVETIKEKIKKYL